MMFTTTTTTTTDCLIFHSSSSQEEHSTESRNYQTNVNFGISLDKDLSTFYNFLLMHYPLINKLIKWIVCQVSCLHIISSKKIQKLIHVYLFDNLYEMYQNMTEFYLHHRTSLDALKIRKIYFHVTYCWTPSTYHSHCFKKIIKVYLLLALGLICY